MIEFINGSDSSKLLGVIIIWITDRVWFCRYRFSEWALSNPAVWSYLRPILADNDGWLSLYPQQRGKNHFYKMYQSRFKGSGELVL